MNKLLVLLLLIMSAAVYSQQDNKELKSLLISDSLKSNIEELNSFKLRFHTLRQKFFSDELNLFQTGVPYSTWMLRSGLNTNEVFAPLLQKGDMIRSYKMLYGIDDDMKYLNMVLGMAETATVGVLAYKHIKKYGLFSK